MALHAILSGLIALLVGLIVYLADRLGNRTCELETIKEQNEKKEKEKARAKQLTNNVNNLSNADVRERLQNISK